MKHFKLQVFFTVIYNESFSVLFDVTHVLVNTNIHFKHNNILDIYCSIVHYQWLFNDTLILDTVSLHLMKQLFTLSNNDFSAYIVNYLYPNTLL